MILRCTGCRVTWESPGFGGGWYEAIRCVCPVGAEPDFEEVDLGQSILDALQRHAVALYEACEPSLSPWPDDPDGSTLRFSGALRDLLGWVAELETTFFGSSIEGAAIALEIRRVIARSLGLPILLSLQSATTTEGRSSSVTNASAPVTRKAPELAHEADILIVGFSEERREFPQFRHQQVFAASSPLLSRLMGRCFRRAYFTTGAQSLRGFDKVEDVLHEAVEKGNGDLVVHVAAYERLAEADRQRAEGVDLHAELVRDLRQGRAFEA